MSLWGTLLTKVTCFIHMVWLKMLLSFPQALKVHYLIRPVQTGSYWIKLDQIWISHLSKNVTIKSWHIYYWILGISFHKIISTENCLVSGIGLNRFSKHCFVPGYSVDSIKRTVLLNVLLQKHTVYWKISRQITFAYCLY